MDSSKEFIGYSSELLRTEFFPRIFAATEQLTNEQVWWRPNEASNSIGNLILHLTGNVTQWIVGGVGKKSIMRDRDKEFNERSPINKSELLGTLEQALNNVAEVLGGLDASSLTERRVIQGNDVTVLQAIYHVVEHFSMHTGQILLLTKIITAKDLRLYEFPDGAAKRKW